jgi:hypothetical protein
MLSHNFSISTTPQGVSMSFRSIRLLSVAFVFTLAACGSTSKLKPTNAMSSQKLATYDVVYVADFANGTNKEIKNPEKAALFEKAITDAGRNFADMIASNLEQTKNAPAVVRAAPEQSDKKVMRIEGKITTFENGNAFVRFMLPLAGAAKFNATVLFVDQESGATLGEILVDKNSNPLGGGFAMSQNANKFMKGAADKIAEQLEVQRTTTAAKVEK